VLPSRSSRWRRAPLRQDRKVLPVLLAKLALRVRLVRPVPRAHKASKDPSVLRAPSASREQLVLPDRLDQSGRRARRGKPVAKAQSASREQLVLPDRLDQSGRRARRGKPVPKAQSDRPANADHQGR